MIQTFSTTSRKAFEVVNRYLIVRYAISGSLSSAIDILVFSFMMEISHLHYAIAAVISVTISFFARFYLQKTFAFKNRTLDVHRQIMMYGVLYIFSIIMTIFFLYIFIDMLHLWYMFAQILTIGIVATFCFFIYRHVIFRPRLSNDIGMSR
ncbi:MAG: hypothetical protein A3C79_01960 [Candidatus Taylorbacteria bacterium RIFCSPHIGHO2_02_FULL_45_28]|uniref:GtrA/DPMS transmembrane domain-containing protein n=1 Tax=Candidatus Taylorbacteria bacterium RIFCSPHIGHO2_12_FULL_45_16 TaxID=1802315 RepID=A0A1G2N250_9BACT|nr:MAG: hypothetical protein A2830_02765 [Candidatus Taylorbacteria bacterium RIFCSPHIGHO2_01_FULL_44_110]OHA25215.1 MAG: hypothetical protein A3C79_01960 [Candidatus Taylorbacteria bacterium RIFCSPHIGHO2_02_FULL_45_28]OHA29459.1 MAG: hypothetical protein A3F51_00270 [Candidatus Taylorbacteria bacterium RIFCSPHIGHO2_12_FULL_45_16]OHA33221.1 MAG: hypothetical protein A3A23_02800 [Candidatus Taylorbacteria bacterium RIFCSPLOWO2_01_FULL_45_59]OHA38271.1 MAG: hypothetical protein A3I98_03065 [Candi